MCNCKGVKTQLIPVLNIVKTLPSNPRQGDSYIIADCTEGDGPHNGKERNIAEYGLDNCSEWCFTPPCVGMYAFVSYAGTSETDPGNVRMYKYDQLKGWVPTTPGLDIS